MSKGNPDISVDIRNALMSMLHAEKTPTLACADIMRIPLEQVVDGCVYQFELVRECDRCEGVGLIQGEATCKKCPQGPTDQACSNDFDTLICEKCDCTDGEITKRISHYDLADGDMADSYARLSHYVKNDLPDNTTIANFKGALRAIKIREV